MAGVIVVTGLLFGCGDDGESGRSGDTPTRSETSTAAGSALTVEKYLNAADAACRRAREQNPVPDAGATRNNFERTAEYFRAQRARGIAIRDAVRSVTPPDDLRIKVNQVIDSLNEVADLLDEFIAAAEAEDATRLRDLIPRAQRAGNEYTALTRDIGYRECDPPS